MNCLTLKTRVPIPTTAASIDVGNSSYIIITRTVTGHTRGQATDKDTKRGQKGRLSGGRPIRLRGSGRKGRKEKTSMHRKGKNVRA